MPPPGAITGTLCQQYCPPTRHSYPACWTRPIRAELIFRGVTATVVLNATRPTLFSMVCVARRCDQGTPSEQVAALATEREYLQLHAPSELAEMERYIATHPPDFSTGKREMTIKSGIWFSSDGLHRVCEP